MWRSTGTCTVRHKLHGSHAVFLLVDKGLAAGWLIDDSSVSNRGGTNRDILEVITFAQENINNGGW